VLKDQLFLPPDYQEQGEAAYFDDTFEVRNDTVFQPEIYPLAERLLAGTGRTRIVDAGCGIGRKLALSGAGAKLGIDFGANLAIAEPTTPMPLGGWRLTCAGRFPPPSPAG